MLWFLAVITICTASTLVGQNGLTLIGGLLLILAFNTVALYISRNLNDNKEI